MCIWGLTSHSNKTQNTQHTQQHDKVLRTTNEKVFIVKACR